MTGARRVAGSRHRGALLGLWHNRDSHTDSPALPQGDAVRRPHYDDRNFLCSPPSMLVVQRACLLVPLVSVGVAAVAGTVHLQAGIHVEAAPEKLCDVDFAGPWVLEDCDNRRLLVADQSSLQ